MRHSHQYPNAKLLILDWDGVAYPYSPRFFYDSISALIKHVVEKHHAELSPQEAEGKEKELLFRTIAYAALHKGKFSGFFTKHYQMEEEEVLREIRKRAKNMAFLKPSSQLHDEIERTQKFGVKIVILSQSTTDWLEDGVAKLGLGDLLDNASLFGKDITGYEKHEGTEAYQHVLDATGIKAKHTLTVDDSSKNLKQARKLGIETISVPKIWQLDALHPFKSKHADHAHRNLLEFLKTFNDERERAIEGWQEKEDKRRQEKKGQKERE